MPNDDLNQAIALIQQGQDEQAQLILQKLIQVNQQDLAAWSWYVKSCRTPEKRLNALELSLRFNPGNPQILEAIRKMREKLSAQPLPTRDFDRTPENFYTSTPEPAPYAIAEMPETSSQAEAARQPDKFTGLDEVSGRPFMWYDVWWLALRYPQTEMYTALLRDPLANPMRAYWWTFTALLVTGLVSLLALLLDPSLVKSLNTITNTRGSLSSISPVIIVAVAVLFPVLMGIGGVLGMILSAAFYNLVAKLFGGSGNFSRTVYLMAAYSAPISILSIVLSFIPCVNVLSIGLRLYSFWLQIVAIQAAQRLNGARATLVVVLPSLLYICIIGVVILTVVTRYLPHYSPR